MIPVVTATLLAVGTFAATIGSSGPISLRAVVSRSECSRFTEPDVAVSQPPDPHYDPEQGETVETIDLVDERTLDEMLSEVGAARSSQIAAAAHSLDIARSVDSANPTARGLYEVTVSFGRTVRLTDAVSLVSPYGMTLLEISHGYVGINGVHIGGIPAVDPNGVPRTLEDIEEEYVQNTRVLLHRALAIETDGATSAARAAVANAEKRVQDAVANGVGVIGVVVNATIEQVDAVVRTVDGVVAGAVPPGCEPHNAVVPQSFVPMIAHRALDMPEAQEGPLTVNSPVAEGR